MGYKFVNHSLKLVIPRSIKNKVDRLMSTTRTSSVSNEILLMGDMVYQDSIIYTWNFGNVPALESKKIDVLTKLSSQNIDNYTMVVA